MQHTTALRQYFETKNESMTMSQQSLSEARNKLTVEAFSHLYKATAEAIVEQRTEKWHGYRLYANDGSKIALPDDKKLLWLML